MKRLDLSLLPAICCPYLPLTTVNGGLTPPSYENTIETDFTDVRTTSTPRNSHYLNLYQMGPLFVKKKYPDSTLNNRLPIGLWPIASSKGLLVCH
jgi:hypothetical protein